MDNNSPNKEPDTRLFEARYIDNNGLNVEKYNSRLKAEQRAEDLIRDSKAVRVDIYKSYYENTLSRKIVTKRKY